MTSRYLLDTNVVSELRKPRPHGAVVAWLDSIDDAQLFLSALTLAEIAERLDLTEEAIKKSVQRLRHRFRDCLRSEIAQTVASPDQLDDELRHLRAALSPGS